MTDCDVVIVGAGLSGLVTARELNRHGLRVLILDARDRIGGRIYTVADDDGHPVELGAAFVGPEQHAIGELAGELGLPLFPTWDAGTHLGHFGGRTHRWSGTTPRLDVRSSLSAAAAIWRLNHMAKSVDPARPWESRRSGVWDGVTVAQWIDRARLTPAALDLLSASLRSIFAADVDALSLLHVLMCIRSAGGFRKYMRASGAQQMRFTHGASELCNRLAADLDHEPILNAAVREVSDDGVAVQVRTATQTITASRAVIAVPPAAAKDIVITGDFGDVPARTHLLTHACSGTVLKYHLYYPGPFWRDAGLSGKTLSSNGIVNATFDHSIDHAGVLVAFTVGTHAQDLLALSEDERLSIILDDLASQFGPAVRTPTRTLTHSWTDDPWSAGCFAAFMPPEAWTRYRVEFREPMNRIHFGGTESATRYYGAMEGAVTAGQRVARENRRKVRVGVGPRPTPRRPARHVHWSDPESARIARATPNYAPSQQ